MKLHNSGHSSTAKRARVMCAEVGEPCECVNVDFVQGDHKKPEFLAKNPNGKVPVMEDGGYVLWESPAMLVYLAGKYPEKNMLPNDNKGRTEALRWMFWNASHFESAVSRVAMETLIKPTMMKQAGDAAAAAAATADVHRFAPVLNGQLEGKQWVVGATFGIADIALATTVELAQMAGVKLDAYPHITAWFNRVTARPSWKA